MSTYYIVMREQAKGMWTQLFPNPRSRRAALRMGEEAASDGRQVRVDRHVQTREVVKTFNRPPKGV